MLKPSNETNLRDLFDTFGHWCSKMSFERNKKLILSICTSPAVAWVKQTVKACTNEFDPPYKSVCAAGADPAFK